MLATMTDPKTESKAAGGAPAERFTIEPRENLSPCLIVAAGGGDDSDGEEEEFVQYKMIILGDGAVGKTSTIMRFTQATHRNGTAPHRALISLLCRTILRRPTSRR